MPIFRVTVKKAYLSEEWENRYFVDALNIADATNYGVSRLAAFERQIHSIDVSFVQARIDDNQPGTDVFFVVPLGGNGTVEQQGDLLPLFNTVRVDLTPSSGGYPGRKYYRGCLGRDTLLLSVVQPARRAAIEAAFDALFLDFADNDMKLVDADGDQHINAVVRPAVAMRQLRRGRLRRTTP